MHSVCMIAGNSQSNMHQNMHHDTRRICENMLSENTNGQHRVKVATANTMDNSRGATRNYKSPERQGDHNKFSSIVHKNCA